MKMKSKTVEFANQLVHRETNTKLLSQTKISFSNEVTYAYLNWFDMKPQATFDTDEQQYIETKQKLDLQEEDSILPLTGRPPIDSLTGRERGFRFSIDNSCRLAYEAGKCRIDIKNA